jgi:type VI secretion system protein
MALRLEIISNHRQQLGPQAAIILGASGGSIGRALDNDWALPDPQRFLSGHHARILYRAGRYYLEDISTNGVFVNEALVPHGPRGPLALQSGDVLRMGEYRMRVEIDAAPPADDQGSPPWLANSPVDHVAPVQAAPWREDLDSSLNIETLIPLPSDAQAKVDAAAARAATAGSSNPPDFSATMPPAGAEAPVAAPAAASTQHRLTRLRAAARARLEGNRAPLADVGNALEALCRGAGIDVAQIPLDAQAPSLYLAGRLLRESLVGLKEILRAQQVCRDRLHLEGEAPEGKSPLDASYEEYLLELLLGHEQHRFDAVLQLREQFSHAGADAAALDPALRSALGQFLAHLAPARMETGPGAAAAAASWLRYKDIYANLLHSSGGEELPHLFLEALAQAWLESRKKGD